MSVEDRSAIMMKIADGIRNRFDEFAAAESKDQGKPLWLSKAMDISRAIQNIEFLLLKFYTLLRNRIILLRQ